MDAWRNLTREIVSCRRCPRLITHCESIARLKKKEFRDWDYWGKPVPGFGDPRARVWILGLAPAAHGANRTGRMFTGDKSGEWLYRVLFENGFANQALSQNCEDGLKLDDVFISASARCAPPDNKPTTEELKNCDPFLEKELQLLTQVQIIVPLGRIAWDTLHRTFGEKWGVKRKSEFAHGKITAFGPWQAHLSYHPSRQNTNTGRLTWPMWNSVFENVKKNLR